MNFRMKISPTTIVATFNSFLLPDKSFKIMYEITPNTIPSAILYESGIIIIVKKAGIASV